MSFGLVMYCSHSFVRLLFVRLVVGASVLVCFAAHVSSFVVLPHDGHVALLLAPRGLQHQETYESHELPRSSSDVRLSDCPLWKVVCSGRRSEISA